MSSRMPSSDRTEPSISPQQLFEAWGLDQDGTSGDPAGALSIKAFFSEFSLGGYDLPPAPVPPDRATVACPAARPSIGVGVSRKGVFRRWLGAKAPHGNAAPPPDHQRRVASESPRGRLSRAVARGLRTHVR